MPRAKKKPPQTPGTATADPITTLLPYQRAIVEDPSRFIATGLGIAFLSAVVSLQQFSRVESEESSLDIPRFAENNSNFTLKTQHATHEIVHHENLPRRRIRYPSHAGKRKLRCRHLRSDKIHQMEDIHSTNFYTAIRESISN